MISTLQKLAGIGTNPLPSPHPAINFNSNLPINVEVLKKLDTLRYRLKIGRKELTTKSQKPLHEGEHYWGNFSGGEGGILTLSNLTRQPLLFQHLSYFLEIPLHDILQPATFSMVSFKSLLVQMLSSESLCKDAFNALSFMLLALNHDVVHLPLHQESKRTLLQFKAYEEGYRFYAAFENLGPIEGTITHNGISIAAQYDKSLYFLDKVVSKLDKIKSLTLQHTIQPLFDAKELSLDLKG